MAGNANSGRKQEKPFRDALRLATADPAKLRRIAEKVVAQCEEGDMEAIKFFAERLDGKVAQPIAGDTDNPLIITNILRTIVDPNRAEDSESILPAPAEGPL